PVLELPGADVILSVFQQFEKFGPAMRGSGQFPACRQQIIGDLEGFLGMGAGRQNARHVASPLRGIVAPGWQGLHRSDTLRSSSNQPGRTELCPIRSKAAFRTCTNSSPRHAQISIATIGTI